ncbi:hypothetical protein [Methylobacterium oryzihabitans]|uniref:Cytochrome c domain-containing protein n=1 Tax=Methylobacterium oryzihabitans TaxID=2499852 RepID=A0A3S2XF15_9HYPH|nr:hypothetical protein [Methylobacterium oryzihabitans]RVU13098.1 hypothetical protein EOE48_27210 [Methylobacterium oryzihabitans]
MIRGVLALACVLVLACVLALPPGRAAAGEGIRLYFGRGLVGRVAGVARPGLTCAGCHGRDGAGPPEGRGRVPAIGGTALAQRPDGAPPYDEAGFARALAEGVAPDGRRLSPGMPRFAVTPEQARRLRAALAALGDEDRAGVAPDRIALVIPALPDDRPAAEAYRDRLRRALESRAPSVYGRAIAVAVEDPTAMSPALLAVGPDLDPAGRLAVAAAEQGLPILMPRGAPPGPVPGDLVDPRPGEPDVTAALRALRDAPGADRDRVVLDADDLAVLPAAPAAGTVFLSLALARAQPAEVAALATSGAALVALRPAAWDENRLAEETARALVAALTLAGRDLTRTALLAALARGRPPPGAGGRVEAVRLPAPSVGR